MHIYNMFTIILVIVHGTEPNISFILGSGEYGRKILIKNRLQESRNITTDQRDNCSEGCPKK